MPALPATASRWAPAAVWVTLPLVGGDVFGDALGDAEPSFRTVASVGLWVVWAVTLGAALVPRSTSLTAIRIVMPASVPALAWAAVDVADPGAAAYAAVAVAAVATAVALAPSTAAWFVDGSSYGAERRLPLRAPGPLLFGPIPLAWAAAVAGAVTGPLLLADGAVAGGVVAVAVGWPAAAAATRALHSLARRWLVLVPAGIVVHDLLSLRDPVLLLTRTVTGVGPALADTDALDLTAAALGLALQIDLGEPTQVLPAGRFGLPAELTEVRAVLVAPTRPAAFLRAAEQRRLPVHRGTA